MLKPVSTDPLWSICTGSVASQEGYKVKLDGHQLAKRNVMFLMLNYFQGEKIFDWLGEHVVIDNDNDFTVDEKLLDKVQFVIDYIRDFHNKASDGFTATVGEVVETPTLKIVCPIIVKYDNIIEVITFSNEYKTVGAINNPELICALGAALDPLDKLDGSTEKLQLIQTVVQPNCSSPYVSTYTNSVMLDKELTRLGLKANEIKNLQYDCPTTVNKLCKTCLASHHCLAFQESKNEVVMQHELIVPKIHGELSTMTDDELGSILSAEEIFIDAFTKAKIEASRRIGEEGKVIQGWHIGKGKNSSKWNADKETVAKKLKGMKIIKDDIFPSKLISPSQARKLQGLTDIQKTNLEKLIDEVTGVGRLTANDYEGVASVESLAAEPVQPVPMTAEAIAVTSFL